MSGEESEDQFIDTQDIAQDIETIYKAFVTEINQYRSQCNTPKQVRFTKFDKATIDKAQHSGLVNRTPQESFCNAFYRLIGLPVISQAGVYSPGYNPNFNTDLARQSKLNTIASAIPQSVYKLLDQREEEPLSRLKNYASGGDTATAQALGLQFLRPICLLEDANNDPLDPETQTHNVKMRNEVKNLFSLPISANLSNVVHIVKPFIVDPRIDLLVQPVRNRIAAPFLSEEERKIGNGAKYKTPLLEKVCKIRFNVANKDGELPQVEEIVNKIKEDKELTDEYLLELAGGGISSFYRAESYVRVHMVKTLRVVVDSLNESVKQLREVQEHIIWLPNPSTSGIEGGLTTRVNPPGLRRSDKSRPELDDKIEFLKDRKIVVESEFETFQTQIGASEYSEIDAVAFGAAMANIPKTYASRLASLTNRRQELEQKAEEALRNIAIIMGDDTGFGLIDMIVIYTALWTLDKEVLVDFLDDDAFNRMITENSLRSAEVEQRVIKGSRLKADPLDILKAFEKQIKLLYKLAQSLYDNNLISSRK